MEHHSYAQSDQDMAAWAATLPFRATLTVRVGPLEVLVFATDRLSLLL